MQTAIQMSNNTIKLLNASAPWVAFLLLRLLIGWEFLEAGLEKYNGENWFEHVKDDFPFPFNSISTDISWFMATWFELIGGIALIIGLGTRFFSVSLIILTIVATAAIHWPADWQSLTELVQGYAITDKGQGNFKLPLIFLTMLLPLVFMGSGKLGLDHLFYRKFNKPQQDLS
ncbi:MAG: DoxX family protein [Psychrosphaera sp.]|nr:DoxX family protein [Psychrosphaera sp.]